MPLSKHVRVSLLLFSMHFCLENHGSEANPLPSGRGGSWDAIYYE